MPRLTPAALRKQIATRNLGPIYLLTGEDEQEKTDLAAEFATAIEEELRAFNVERFYGGDATRGELVESMCYGIIEAARSLPFAADRRIILVMQADRLLEPTRESEAAARGIEALAEYVKAPHAQATVVFVAAELDKRRRIAILLEKEAATVECSGFSSLVDAERWVRAQIAEAGLEIEVPAMKHLVSLAGTDVTRLRGDVGRLLLYAVGQKRISVSDVREVVGPAVSQDDWALTDALTAGSVTRALKELALALDAGAVPYMILGQLAWFVRTRMTSSGLPDAVEALFRTDLDLKSSAGDPRVLLERLVVELCPRERRMPNAE